VVEEVGGVRERRGLWVGRVCDALEFLADHPRGVTKHQVAEHRGCVHRTALRLLESLEARGFTETAPPHHGRVRLWKPGERLRSLLEGRAAG
jgi:DNA-binding IclR family transcriptional regulator